MKRIIIIILLLFIAIPTFANPSVKKSKTAVYGTVGTFVLYFNSGINVERKVWEPGSFLMNELWIRGGLNWWVAFANEGMSVVLSAQALTGKNVLHFEYGIGMAYSPSYTSGWNLLPAANLGLRFQKPGSSLILRSGVGFPEIAYLSAGYAF